MSLHFLVVTEEPWRAVDRANVSAPLVSLNSTALGNGRLHYAERVGGDPLVAFAHLVAADVLTASDSHFSIAAAQLSVGVQLRIRRQGFSAADAQQHGRGQSGRADTCSMPLGAIPEARPGAAGRLGAGVCRANAADRAALAFGPRRCNTWCRCR